MASSLLTTGMAEGRTSTQRFALIKVSRVPGAAPVDDSLSATHVEIACYTSYMVNRTDQADSMSFGQLSTNPLTSRGIENRWIGRVARS
jgi:hypothetical protein